MSTTTEQQSQQQKPTKAPSETVSVEQRIKALDARVAKRGCVTMSDAAEMAKLRAEQKQGV